MFSIRDSTNPYGQSARISVFCAVKDGITVTLLYLICVWNEIIKLVFFFSPFKFQFITFIDEVDEEKKEVVRDLLILFF